MNATKVLLVTSAQVDLLSENGKAWGFTKESVTKNEVKQNLKVVLAKARENNIPIIHSPVGFPFSRWQVLNPKTPFNLSLSIISYWKSAQKALNL
nr:hypothetical protein [uncultured Draconibacterium sp.]